MGIIKAIVFTLVLATLARAQSSEPVEFVGADKLTLYGTLRLPAAAEKEKVPAVLFIAGSGPTDQNGNQPSLAIDLLKQWAEGLQANGIASLCYDKRAVARYAGDWPEDDDGIAKFFSMEKQAADAKAAFQILRSRPQVDSKRVFILGHSEGGLFALKLGNEIDPAPAGVILAATAGRNLEDVLRAQIHALLKKQVPNEEARKPIIDALEAAIVATRRGEPLPETTPVGLRPLFNPSTKIFLKEVFETDPTELASNLTCPVLVLQGENDLQITAKDDLPMLTAALESRKDVATQVVLVPKASHNFKATKDANDPAFFGDVIPSTTGDIANWIKTTE